MNIKRALPVLLLVLALSIGFVGAAFAAPPPQVDVCVPLGNGGYQKVNVAQPAADAIIAQGGKYPDGPNGECLSDSEPPCEVDCEPPCEVDCEPPCEVDCEPPVPPVPPVVLLTLFARECNAVAVDWDYGYLTARVLYTGYCTSVHGTNTHWEEGDLTVWNTDLASGSFGDWFTFHGSMIVKVGYFKLPPGGGTWVMSALGNGNDTIGLYLP